jgi:hypothetical protein
MIADAAFHARERTTAAVRAGREGLYLPGALGGVPE